MKVELPGEIKSFAESKQVNVSRSLASRSLPSV